MSSRRIQLKKKWAAAINSAERAETHMLAMKPIYAEFHPKTGEQIESLIEAQESLVQVMKQLASSL